MSYRGHIRNGVAVLDDGVKLAEGSEVVVQPVEAPSFWDAPTVQELAQRQRTRPWSDLSELAGDWPAEDSVDEFLAAVKRARR
jgi:hypothetical protein